MKEGKLRVSVKFGHEDSCRRWLKLWAEEYGGYQNVCERHFRTLTATEHRRKHFFDKKRFFELRGKLVRPRKGEK